VTRISSSADPVAAADPSDDCSSWICAGVDTCAIADVVAKSAVPIHNAALAFISDLPF
jgi:hypothetical protein